MHEGRSKQNATCYRLLSQALVSFVQSTPQLFGQSFSSSSITRPNGEVVSNSIYTDTLGNKVVNGNSLPILVNTLLPPFGGNDNQPAPTTPIATRPPITTRLPAATTRPTTRPTAASQKVNAVGKWPADGSYIPDHSGAYVHDDRGSYRRS